MKKRGLFFTVDAVMAIGIIVIGLLLIMSLRIEPKSSEQASLLSRDVIDLISTTEIYTINNDYLFSLRQDGNITNIRYTLLEQIGEFYILNQTDLAFNTVVNVTSKTFPGQYDFAVLVDGYTVFNTSDTQDNSTILISSKKIIMGIMNQTTYWGPLSAEVRVWR